MQATRFQIEFREAMLSLTNLTIVGSKLLHFFHFHSSHRRPASGIPNLNITEENLKLKHTLISREHLVPSPERSEVQPEPLNPTEY